MRFRCKHNLEEISNNYEVSKCRCTKCDKEFFKIENFIAESTPQLEAVDWSCAGAKVLLAIIANNAIVEKL